MKKICFLIFFISSAHAIDVSAMKGMVFGQYDLIGKSIGSKNTYFGEVSIAGTDENMTVTRTINGKIVKGTAAIEHTTGEKIHVLRMRFEENGKNFEETCLVDIDLDNYARLTCHLYIPNETVSEPGLEAMFIKHED